MATERGWVIVTVTCPSCLNNDSVTVFGGDNFMVGKIVTCSRCRNVYSVEITISLTASVAIFEHIGE